ncbi:MAG: peptide chain release factor N(5)-glutamine methyltransferase [Chloroflexota bacterium]
MKLSEALSQAQVTLARSNKTQDATLEAEVLLRHALGIDRVMLFLELNRQITAKETAEFSELIERRFQGEPVAYITGHKEFYGLDFQVSPAVLIPRPETETLVDKALELSGNDSVIADIGTGSGNIAVSLALKLPRAKIYATDISDDALKVARFNAEKHGALDKILFLQGDLLEILPEPCDIIVANLPYVRESELPELRFEPEVALNGGKDGLNQIRRLIPQVSSRLKMGGYLLLEIGMGEAHDVRDIILSLYPKARVEIIKDLAGIERVVSVRLT